MISYQKKDIYKALGKVKITKGDSVFVTSSIALIGIPKTSQKNKSKIVCNWIYNSIKKKIGPKGNIFVPTYSYTFERKKKNIFDIKKTPAKIGLFPNFFLKKKDVVRSLDPMVSISGIGPDAKLILNEISESSYGKNCVFEKFLKIKKLKCLTIGLGYNWIPFIHYLDWLNKVPFRYDKYFKGYVINKNNVKKLVKWHYPVRYLNNNSTISDGYKLGRLAYKKGMFEEKNVGRSKVLCINYKSYFKFCKNKSKKNKWITASGKKN